MTDPIKPAAYGSRNADGDIWMLSFDVQEARTYCDEGEEPAALVDPSDVAALVQALRDAAAEVLRLSSDDSPTDWNVAFNRLHDARQIADAFLAQHNPAPGGTKGQT